MHPVQQNSLTRKLGKIIINGLLALTAMAVLAPRAAQASNFEIAPVILELSGARMAGAIRFVNKDDHEVSLQVRGFDWTQVDGEDVLQPATVLLVSPPIFTLAPGAAQTIRVVSQLKDVAAETAFRLLIDEIPPPSKEAAISFKFRVSMPIFVEPATTPVQKLDWQLSARGAPQLKLNNVGGRRAKLMNLVLILPSGRRLTPTGAANPYTLAGGGRVYAFAPDAELKAGATVKISAVSDTGNYETSTVVLP